MSLPIPDSNGTTFLGNLNTVLSTQASSITSMQSTIATLGTSIPIITGTESPNDSLLHFENNYTDSIGNNLWLPNGNYLSFTTSNPKFGTYCLSFGSAGNTTDWVSRVNNINLNSLNAYTIEMWVRFDNTSGWQSIFDIYPDNNLGLALSGSRMQLYAGCPGAWSIANGVNGTYTSYTSNTWYHVALVYSNTYGYKVYINGTLDISVANIAPIGTPSQIRLGGWGGNNSGAPSMIGAMDEFRLTQGVAVYTSNFTPPTSAFIPFLPSNYPASPTVGQNVIIQNGYILQTYYNSKWNIVL